ncbi:arylamine N-acetyltransferase family protein [Desertimonas flava]|jgi:N-hydroxyarylamine O-acetyltransferase|uniref:arylamine N-acetyltransferase family protein n=1 Tax=Desertimonas flava TaxID=2064846 RepID=UPI000E34382B|nr:arylamine N-acetyltransferase [Desertimonas flava]
MNEQQVDEYLARIGASRDTPLADLQRLHLHHVPFENLDIHLGKAITIDPDALFDKVVHRRRGGFCYELNGLFADLLDALGADVQRLGSRVWGGGRFGPPLDHMQLVATWPDADEPHLVDVGFGRFATEPLRWTDRVDQTDPTGVYRLADTGDGLVDVSWNGAPVCRTDPRPLELADFAAMCWFQQTSPDSHFTQGPTCSRLDAGGRVTLAGHLLIRTSAEGTRTETTLGSDEEVLTAYRDHFGIELDRLPTEPAPPGSRS